MYLYAMTVLVVGLFGSSALADMLGFNLFAPFLVLLELLLLLPVAPFYLVFWLLNPLVQAICSRHDWIFLRRAWNFPIDCVLDWIQAISWVLDKLGIE